MFLRSSRRAVLSAVVVAVFAGGCACGHAEEETDSGIMSPDAGGTDAGSADAGAVDAGDVDAGSDDAGTSCLLDGGLSGTRCGAACVDLTTDPAHCGTCEQQCQPGSICRGQCEDVVGSLDGLRWELPCTSAVLGDGYSCQSPATFTTSTVVSGVDGGRYDVQLHFRGLVEQRTYGGATSAGATGGQADGGINPEFFVEGGSVVTSDPYNVYTLSVDYPSSAPTKSFRLNAGASNIHYCFEIDYYATINVETGSTLVLSADSIEGAIISNLDGAGQPIIVPDVPPAPQAFNGQFVQVDVVSVTPAP